MSFMVETESTWPKDSVETRVWKVARGLTLDKCCRECKERDETVEHLVAGCKVLANSEYLTRHNRALMIMALAWAKEFGLINNDTIWFKDKCERGRVLEKTQVKLIWDSSSICGSQQRQDDLI